MFAFSSICSLFAKKESYNSLLSGIHTPTLILCSLFIKSMEIWHCEDPIATSYQWSGVAFRLLKGLPLWSITSLNAVQNSIRLAYVSFISPCSAMALAVFTKSLGCSIILNIGAGTESPILYACTSTKKNDTFSSV